MLSGVCIGSNDLEAAKRFYDQVLATIGMKCHICLDHELGYGLVDESPTVWIVSPYNKEPATFGNGTQVMFETQSEADVNAFYNTAINLGGIDEGAPGPRDYAPKYYGAYVRDLDGNKLHISIKL